MGAEGGGQNFQKLILNDFLAKLGNSKHFSFFFSFFSIFSRLGFWYAQTRLFGGRRGHGGVPKWFGRLIYTIDGMKKPPEKFQNSY